MSLLTFCQDIANAIRAKTGKTEPMLPINFPAEIAKISTNEPIDVYTKQEIEEAITDENIGKIYRFKGVSVPGYATNGLYIVEVDNG